MNKIIIFTDGSSKGNPGPGGWGAIIKCLVDSEESQVKELGGYEEKTTNNRMEMTAVISALAYLFKLQTTNNKLVIYSDSSYVINGATKWLKGWEANGWKTKAGGEVLNLDLWKEMLLILKKFDIEWKQVEGHRGMAGNERCDVIATSFADKNPVSLYEGALSKYPIKINLLEYGSEEKKYSKSSSAKAYSYVSLVDGKIMTHKTWSECEARVKGKSNTRFRKSISAEDEKKIIADFSK